MTASSRSPPAVRSTCPARRSRHGHRRARAGRVRPRGRGQELPREHRAAHRPLPEGQARRLHAAADRRSPRSGWRAACEPLFQSHMWDGSAVPLDENLAIAAGAARASAPGARSSWRSRSASSAARRTASSARSTRSSTRPPRTRCAPSRPLGPRREGPLPARARPSATCTASTSRATSSCAREC